MSAIGKQDQTGDSLPAPPEALLERLKDYGQEHTLERWPELTPPERDLLVQDLELVDLPRVTKVLRTSLKPRDRPDPQPIPESDVSTLELRSQEDRERWWGMGLRAIGDGALAVLLLSGGQVHRSSDLTVWLGVVIAEIGSFRGQGRCQLHFGMRVWQGRALGWEALSQRDATIGLPSGKSLFQLQAERILRVQFLASQLVTTGKLVRVPWYIMTSSFTDFATRTFFENRKYFGLDPEQVIFSEQGTLPCISKDGRFVLATSFKVAQAPDGNGGVYAALKSSGCLDNMSKRGVKYVDVYSVDNAVVRVADPLFLRYCIERGAPAAAKVIKKAYPQEKVGVFAHAGNKGPVTVFEYSELDPALQFAINQESGRLAFKWSNICIFLLSLDLLNTVVAELDKDSMSRLYEERSLAECLRSREYGKHCTEYHLAEKSIDSAEGKVQCIKLERFIFDCFPYAPWVALFEVIREEEFAPVKNAVGMATDTPDTARTILLRLHMNWVVEAGGHVVNKGTNAAGLEVSPLVSYAGEGLGELCYRKMFNVLTELAA